MLDGHEVSALFAREPGMEGQFRHPNDRVHRRADLVAHIGEKIALRPGGLFRLAPGRLQLPGVLLQFLFCPPALDELSDLAADRVEQFKDVLVRLSDLPAEELDDSDDLATAADRETKRAVQTLF